MSGFLGSAVPAELVPGCFEPCPFCAAGPDLLEVFSDIYRDRTWYQVYCGRCNAKGPPGRSGGDGEAEGQQAARTGWNQRGGRPW